MESKPTRRDVLKTTAGISMGMILTRVAGAETPRQTKSDRVRFACVGVGGKGESDTADAAKYGEVVAICDPDLETRIKAMRLYPMAAAFSDYRVMLDAMHGSIDAVTVSTPDHNHAPAAAMAMHLGKHVYCQKPLTHTIHEARVLAKLARDKKVATQMGNQGTASDDLRRVAAAIKSGAFGAVKEVHCWTDRAKGWWPQGVSRPESKPVPATLDWDVWLGPAPMREYAEGYHPFAWRGFWDFGCGALGDMGCHIMNLSFMALDLRDPIAVRADSSGNNKETYPEWSVVRYEFGARGARGPVTLTWYDGGQKPSQDLVAGAELSPGGSIIVCEKGTLFCPNDYGAGTKVIGGGEIPDVPFDKSPGHFAEFVDAVKDGKPAVSNFPNYASALTETVLLGNLAVWASGERLEWDAKGMKVKGRPDLDPLLTPTYRKGWTL